MADAFDAILHAKGLSPGGRDEVSLYDDIFDNSLVIDYHNFRYCCALRQLIVFEHFAITIGIFYWLFATLGSLAVTCYFTLTAIILPHYTLKQMDIISGFEEYRFRAFMILRHRCIEWFSLMHFWCRHWALMAHDFYGFRYWLSMTISHWDWIRHIIHDGFHHAPNECLYLIICDWRNWAAADSRRSEEMNYFDERCYEICYDDCRTQRFFTHAFRPPHRARYQCRAMLSRGSQIRFTRPRRAAYRRRHISSQWMLFGRYFRS